MQNPTQIALVTYETCDALFQTLVLIEDFEIVDSFNWSLN